MASVYDRVFHILEVMRERGLMREVFLVFKHEFTFLSIFVEWIHKWSDSEENIPEFGPLVNRIETAIQEIAKQIVLEFRATRKEVESPSFVNYWFPKADMFPYKRFAPKWSVLFSSFNQIINLLKPEIKQVCDSLLIHPFQGDSTRLDFDHWKKFFPYLESCLFSVCVNGYRSGDSLVDPIFSTQIRLRWIEDVRDGGFPLNSKLEDFMIYVRSVSFRAALLSCQWWAKEFDPNMKDDMSSAFWDLQNKICLNNPEFADMFLRLLQTLEKSQYHTTLPKFVGGLLSLERETSEYSSFHWKTYLPKNISDEMLSLIISFINMPGEDAENVEKFFPVIKLLIAELVSLKLHRDDYKTVALNFLAKLWLLRADIMLSRLLNSGNILGPVEKAISTLKSLIKVMRKIKKKEEGNTENVNKILRLMEEVAGVVKSLDYQCCAKDIQDTSRIYIFEQLLKILLSQAESSFVKLHESNEGLTIPIKDGLESLHEGFKILMTSVINQPKDTVKDGKPEYARIEAVARRVIPFYDSCLTQNVTEETIKNMNLLLSDLQNETRLIMTELKDTYFQVPRSNFPKVDGVGFVDSLLGRLRELLNCKANLIVSVKHPTEEILGDLQFFRHFLGDVLEQDIEIQQLKDLSGRVADVAYEAEYLIDSIVSKSKVEWHTLQLHLFLQDIRLLKNQVTGVLEKTADDAKVLNHVPKTLRHMVSKATSPRVDEAIVGLKDEEEVIIDRLLRGYQERDTISIVGMPGIGKTTLAKKVYNSPQVVYHFHIRAWGCVSEVYRKRDLLLQILSYITATTDKILEMTDEDLEMKLYQFLKLKRYLIVLDDMWNSEAWDDFRKLFPNDGNQSRILITSRHLDVALEAKANTDPYLLRLLSDAESWDLLQKKIFHGEQCDEDLMDIGERISKSCKGLPLAIVAMAGLLQRTERQQNQWKKIAEDLSKRIVDDPEEQCRKILELSYKHLPDLLKACFLYLGAFQEDENIPVRKLIRLWIAEGFVRKTELKTVEDVANDYLMDLIGRSLVLIAQERSGGGVKACRIHDMLRNLCQSKAKEENFLQIITRFDESNDPFDDLNYGVDISNTDPSNFKTYEDHRLCFNSKRKHFVQSRPSGPHVRSLLFFATNDGYPRCPYDLTFISHNFKLLKVLDLECINMGTSFLSGIEALVHLRYLAVTGDIDSVPPSIANLWNLETFVLKGLKGKVTLPDNIWCLAKLRHVHVSSLAIFILHDDILGDCSKLGNLITLSSPFFRYGEDTSYILRQFPNLRKLRCIFSESLDNSLNCNQFPGLDVLTQLESLKVSYHGKTSRPGEFIFPDNLKKLSLSNFRLPWSGISIIGSLPNLEVLKLLSKAFVGEIWDMQEGEFPKLKFLKLDNLNIAKWNASCDHLPKLQQLVLQCCTNLEEIPASFVEIHTLQMIEVQWCGDSVEESVRKIKDEADEALKVIINLSDLDSRPSS